MNNQPLDDIKGLVQYVAGTDDINKKYSTVKQSSLYHYENLDSSLKFGIVISFFEKESEKWCINIPLSFRAFLNVKFYSDYHSIKITTMHTVMNLFSNRHDIRFVCGIVKDIHEDYFESFLIMGDGEKYTAVDLPLSDIMSMTNSLSFPVFVNNEIIKKRKIDFNTVMKHLN